MKKFEYKHDYYNEYIMKYQKQNITYEQYLNILGQEGWEIIDAKLAKREIEPEITVKKNNDIER
ncbi:MAG: hypothetical protein MJ179_00975 [Treponema sp.]|nr:hypothetical protein [Treponema sp.]